MTNTNNNNAENWEPSTKHRDEQNKKESESKIIKKLIGAVNLALKGYNATIGRAAGWVNVDIKLPELDPNKSASEIMSGGGALSLGIVDDAIKGIRRIGLPALQAVSVFGWGGPQIAAFLSAALAPAEIAVDHLKDAMTSMAFSGLAADIGDLKDGQAKLNAKVDAQGKRLGQKMDNIKSELEGALQQQGEKFDEEIKELDKKIAENTGEIQRQAEEQKKALAKQKQERDY